MCTSILYLYPPVALIYSCSKLVRSNRIYNPPSFSMSTTSGKPFVLHWGIIGAGQVSSDFVKDLVLPPEGRNVADVAHAVAAVGSRSLDKAQEFIRKFCPEGGSAQKTGLVETKPVARGAYAEVYSDKVSNINAFRVY